MKKMNIWFVCIGEPVPTDKDLRNLHRCGQFALEFSKSGNKVNWITSNFDHFSLNASLKAVVSHGNLH